MSPFALTLPRLSILFLASALALSWTTSGDADTQRELREAVARMNSWLGVDADGRRWRQILNLNVLDAQAALGNRADSMALFDIQARFQSNLPGLDHPVFRQVSDAIAAHRQQLPRNNADIDFAIDTVRPRFRPARLADLEKLRDQVVYDLKMLKRYYKTSLTSRPRALLYYELKPDQTANFFSDLTFELPPERSRKAIEAEMEAVKGQIERVEKQIENLNQQREKLLDWMRRLDGMRPPDGVEPPQPDDDLEEPQPAPAAGVDTSVPPSTGVPTRATVDAEPPQDQLEEIDGLRSQLQQSKQELQDRIEQLKQEIQDLRQNERNRNRRFRAKFRQLNDYLAPYEDLVSKQTDLYFGNALKSLLRLKAAYFLAANPNVERLYQRRLDELQEAHALLLAANDRRAAATVGAATGWIESAGQAPDLVGAIRKKYSLPNLHVSVSNLLVNQLAGQPVSQVERVNEQILGRLIRGVAYLDGNVSVKFEPDPWQVRAAIDLSAQINSDTFARSGPFTAFAGANAPVNFRRNIFANIGGLFAGDVYGDLQINSYFSGIDSNLGLIQRVAMRQYQKSKQRSEEISRERTIGRIRPRFAAETATALEDAYQQFKVLRQRQTDLGLLLPSIYLHTTYDRLIVVGHRSTNVDLAATRPPNRFDFVQDDVQVRVHESLPSNYVSPLVAGKTLTNKQIEAKFKEFLGDAVPAPAPAVGDPANAPVDEEFSITFDEARPIQVEFDGNTIAVTVSGTRFSRGNERIDNGLRIRVAVKIERNGGQLQLLPASEVQVELIDPRKKNITTVNFMSFLETKLSQVLREAFKKDVMLPLNLIPVEKLGPEIQPIASMLQLVQLRMEGGWLYSGWKYQASGQNSYATVDLPGIWSPTRLPAPGTDLLEPVPDAENGLELESTVTSLPAER